MVNVGANIGVVGAHHEKEPSRLRHSDCTDLDRLGGGLRWFARDSRLSLLPGALPRLSADSDKSWVDPFIGIRISFGGQGK